MESGTIANRNNRNLDLPQKCKNKISFLIYHQNLAHATSNYITYAFVLPFLSSSIQQTTAALCF
jgi:hypothetical protein